MRRFSSGHLPLAAYLVGILLGGFNAIAVRFTIQELPPFWGATIRFAPAGLILFGLVFALKLPIPKGRALSGAVLFGAINFGISYALIYWGLEKVQPGMAQVILAMVPLFTLLFAVLQRQEHFRWRALLGSLLAVAGIGLVFREQIRANVPLFSLLSVSLGSLCFAEASVIAKSFPKSHPITTNAIGMSVGALMLFGMALLWREPLVLPVKPATWIALIYLILIGSCTVFILFLYTLKYWSASALSYQYVLLPFVALTASAWLTHESLSASLLAGAGLVLLGVLLGGFVSNRRTRSEPQPTTSLDDAA